LEGFNLKLFYWLHNGAGQRPLVDGFAVFMAEAGPYLLMGGLVLLWFAGDDMRRRALLEATEAASVGLLVNQLVGLLYYHPRPYMLGLAQPLIGHSPENSFPSDHATLMLTAAMYMLCRPGCRRPGLLFLVFALSTAWGRVYAGVHFPFDILGSLLVAGSSLILVLGLRTRIEPLNRFLIQTYLRIATRMGFRPGVKPAV